LDTLHASMLGGEMRLRSALFTLFTTLTLAFVPASQAALMTFDVELAGGNENPPVASPGTGTATVIIDTVLRTMLLDVDFSGLLGTTTASHIHCCTVPTMNAGVATQVPTFVGFPLGVTSGSYDQLFDMNLDSSYNPAFIAANGGTALAAFDVLLTNIINGRAYLNIHSTFAPGGEIRGTLIKVPEPGSLGLLIGGLVALLLARWRSAA
jgi:hypothetical protein